jgi:hypothetical protein
VILGKNLASGFSDFLPHNFPSKEVIQCDFLHFYVNMS